MCDVLPPCENSGSVPKVNIGWSEIAETFVVTPSVGEIDELRGSRFELSRQVIILQQNAILQRAVTLDLALGHRMARLAAGVTHAVLFEPGAERPDGPLSLSNLGHCPTTTARLLSVITREKAM